MSIVTIRGLMGSGAPEIGKMLAMKMHGDYIDREVIRSVAVKLNRQENTVEEKENPKGGLWGRIEAALARGYAPAGVPLSTPEVATPPVPVYLPTWESPLDDANYLQALENVIKSLVSVQPVVIRGRGSQFILKSCPNSTHILIVAPLELRVKRVMMEKEQDEETAKKEISRFDNSNREFTRRYFKSELLDPVHYDLVLNTGRYSFESVVDLIMHSVEIKKPKEK